MFISTRYSGKKKEREIAQPNLVLSVSCFLFFHLITEMEHFDEATSELTICSRMKSTRRRVFFLISLYFYDMSLVFMSSHNSVFV